MPPFQSKIFPLERYGHNLTVLARQGSFAPLQGQDATVSKLFQILLREDKKRHPLLLDDGEARRWKVVAEAIRRMAVGDAPDPLPQRQVIALDYEALLADLPNKKEPFEQRLRSIFNAMHESAGSFVLFLDHFHRFLGGEESEIDAATVLVPFLFRREFQRTIQLIGACTLEQYWRDIECDAAFQRCTFPFFTPEAEQEYQPIRAQRDAAIQEKIRRRHFSQEGAKPDHVR
ncbi:hypothetical protein KSC_023750 [Ktedonobacter sp. SOSP1-52]|uniref:hypothetical protein n=1 Tax=Ktedonobacter sp. SOSP1-52 TaxID=2778366 RepID=UPI0019151CEA|nr:hypothetical protein [Ktedonobacter sp. SOSP1-52]GHO63483.1 hypothetical protein KSC_023750 [Ktedonobacter sp. SOSP1-52]